METNKHELERVEGGVLRLRGLWSLHGVNCGLRSVWTMGKCAGSDLHLYIYIHLHLHKPNTLCLSELSLGARVS